MKIALYIEDGLEQIVLTPTTETEKGILGKLHDDSRELAIHRGEFYPCKGGWTRHQERRHSGIYDLNKGDGGNSTMIVLRPVDPQDSPDQ